LKPNKPSPPQSQTLYKALLCGKNIEARATPNIAPHPIDRAPPYYKNYSEGAIMATVLKEAMVAPVARHACPTARVVEY